MLAGDWQGGKYRRGDELLKLAVAGKRKNW
jgi:hypothetical protein